MAMTAAVAQEPQRPVVGVDPHLDAAGDTTRFVLTLSAPVEVSFEPMSRPLRLVADLPEITFQSVGALAKPVGLVRDFRAGRMGTGRSRIIFDLVAPARVASSRLVQRDAGLFDLHVEFVREDPDAFRQAAEAAAERRGLAALAPLGPPPAPSRDQPVTVVIDPGHGGLDPGAVTAQGQPEKVLVLDMALRLRKRLEAAGGIRVLMTREDDRFVSLRERVRLAREEQADLFVSLHADSLSSRQEVRGATVYTGSERATDAESARLAQKENAVDVLAGAETPAASEDILDILSDLARRESRAQSVRIAVSLVQELSGAVRMHRVPQRSAGFLVLSAPDVPSVLIELGYLSSRRDSELMMSAEWQERAAGALAQAIVRHFGERTSRPAPEVATPRGN